MVTREFTPSGRLYDRLVDIIGPLRLFRLGVEVTTDPVYFTVRVRVRVPVANDSPVITLHEPLHEFPSEKLVATILLFANSFLEPL